MNIPYTPFAHHHHASLDFIRGLAVLGMFLTHYVPTHTDGTILGSIFAYLTTLAYGKASALFCILAGISWSFMAQRHQSNPRLSLYYFRRSIGLVLMGGVMRFVLWPSEILTSFALYMWLMWFFLFSKKRTLCYGLVLCTLAVIPLNLYFAHYVSTDWASDGSYLKAWSFGSETLRYYFFNGDYPVFPFLSFIFTGVMIGRINWYTIGYASRVCMIGGTLFLLCFIYQIWIEQNPTILISYRAHFLNTWIPTTVLFFLSGTSVALFLLGGIFWLELSHIPFNYFLYRFVCSLGRLSLTHYLLHITLTYPILNLYWPDWDWSARVGAWVFIGYLCICFIFYRLGFGTKKRGPAEWCIRALSGRLKA